jgi:hypothetical protein
MGLSVDTLLVLARGVFRAGFPTKKVHKILFSPVHATCSAYFVLLQLIT